MELWTRKTQISGVRAKCNTFLTELRNYWTASFRNKSRKKKMAAEELFCNFHQFGHCKFGSTCRKLHTKETCNTFKCIISDCSYRHPRQCKFFVLYGRCKFGTDCSFLHVTTEDEVTKAIKTIQDEVLSLKKEILSLKSINLNLQSSLNSIKEEMKTDQSRWNRKWYFRCFLVWIMCS